MFSFNAFLISALIAILAREAPLFAQDRIDLKYDSPACAKSSFVLPGDSETNADASGPADGCLPESVGLAMFGDFVGRSSLPGLLLKKDVSGEVRAKVLSNLESLAKMRSRASALLDLGLMDQIPAKDIQDAIGKCDLSKFGLQDLRPQAKRLVFTLLKTVQGSPPASVSEDRMPADDYVKRFIVAADEDQRIRTLIGIALNTGSKPTPDLYKLYLRLRKIRKTYPAIELIEGHRTLFSPEKPEIYPELDQILFGNGPLPKSLPETGANSQFMAIVNQTLAENASSPLGNDVKSLVLSSTRNAIRGMATLCSEPDPCKIYGAALSTTEELVSSEPADERQTLASAVCSCKIGKPTSYSSAKIAGYSKLSVSAAGASAMLAKNLTLAAVCALLTEGGCPLALATRITLAHTAGFVATVLSAGNTMADTVGAFEDYFSSSRSLELASSIGSGEDRTTAAARHDAAESRAAISSTMTAANMGGATAMVTKIVAAADTTAQTTVDEMAGAGRIQQTIAWARKKVEDLVSGKKIDPYVQGAVASDAQLQLQSALNLMNNLSRGRRDLGTYKGKPSGILFLDGGSDSAVAKSNIRLKLRTLVNKTKELEAKIPGLKVAGSVSTDVVGKDNIGELRYYLIATHAANTRSLQAIIPALSRAERQARIKLLETTVDLSRRQFLEQEIALIDSGGFFHVEGSRAIYVAGQSRLTINELESVIRRPGVQEILEGR